ncbi:zinc finger transcription factor [Lithospermum erythrorhizon]|uniref:GATA transcription factor n=1 Tax=Lithospermum erythrorhizon TaxID=34254 RepID=A0AAV3Q5R5_LITER
MEASSEFIISDNTQMSPEETNNFANTKMENNNHFLVDDLLDFPQEDDEAMTDAFFESLTGNSGGSSPIAAVDSFNSSNSGGDNNTQFNGNVSCRSFTDVQFPCSELCVPYDDLAELEWLSNFVEESSFSNDDLRNLQFIPTSKLPSTTISNNSNQNSPSPFFPADVSVPGKARSKRSRAAPYDWSSRLLVVSPGMSLSENNLLNDTHCNTLDQINANVTHDSPKPVKTASSRRRENADTPGRKCLHCASEKTPQWRTGPMGPKTLCNACGVRYKSGRLVPEYRPASSPTFISAKHSNSHRKVIELRRQKEMQREQAQAAAQQLLTQNAIFGLSNGPDDYLIHHHQPMNGPDYRHLI